MQPLIIGRTLNPGTKQLEHIPYKYASTVDSVMSVEDAAASATATTPVPVYLLNSRFSAPGLVVVNFHRPWFLTKCPE
jgi:hypothetical protein